MKVISLLQPWATLVVLGHKKIETRSWQTSFRGDLLIHASAGNKGLQQLHADPFGPLHTFMDQLGIFPFYFPTGCIIGKAHVQHILTTDAIREMKVFHYGSSRHWRITPEELAFGDYSPKRFGWLLSDNESFEKPIPAKGKLGIWEYDI